MGSVIHDSATTIHATKVEIEKSIEENDKLCIILGSSDKHYNFQEIRRKRNGRRPTMQVFNLVMVSFSFHRGQKVQNTILHEANQENP